MRRRIAPFLLALALLSPGCAVSEPPAGEDAAPLERCTDPRPQMCTKDYRPACGHRCAEPPCEPAERRTYGNACDACAHPEVVAVTPGACGAGPSTKIPSLR